MDIGASLLEVSGAGVAFGVTLLVIYSDVFGREHRSTYGGAVFFALSALLPTECDVDMVAQLQLDDENALSE